MADEFNTEGMLDMYLFENEQLLEQLQEMGLDQKDAECFDEDSINEIFRTMHTIKGSSGIMMFDNITAISHKLEDVFFYLRESHPDNVPHLELVEHVLEVEDFITGEMEKIKSGQATDGDPSGIIANLDQFLNKIQNGGEENETKDLPQNVHEEPKQFYIAPVASSDSRFYKINIIFFQETEMANVHAYKVVYALKEIAEDILYSPEDIIADESSAQTIIEKGFRILLQAQASEEEVRNIIGVGYDIEKVDIYECHAEEFLQGFDFAETSIDLESSVEEIEAKKEADKGEKKENAIAPGDFVIKPKEPGKPKKLAKDKAKSDKATFISVNVNKMDMLMDLIGELVISESVVMQNPDLKVPGLDLTNFNKAASQMAKISTDLQNVIMSMRMVPLTNTFQKMNRIVFDVSRKLGKDIDFEMVGENTEVDKNIIEHISDPLMHLVRNAVDHGIETDEERKSTGKREKGKVTLAAKTEAGKVWISVTDNGKGLERDKILAKARKQGILEEGKPDSAYTDKEVYQFITLPGFSTNEQVTEYSGRGVGMDVVKKNVESVGGTITITSELGKGSCTTLKIPLTMAIADGMEVSVGNSMFTIPIANIRQSFKPEKDEVLLDAGGNEIIKCLNEFYPIIRVHDLFNIETEITNIEDGILIWVEAADKSYCLFVDELLGEQQVVVKPLPPFLSNFNIKNSGISGCTILGDGDISLILDIRSLYAAFYNQY